MKPVHFVAYQNPLFQQFWTAEHNVSDAQECVEHDKVPNALKLRAPLSTNMLHDDLTSQPTTTALILLFSLHRG